MIEELTAAHEDFALFEGLPGAGAALAPRLLAAFGSRRERFENAGEVQTTSGIAPVRNQSGKRERVHVRWACPKFWRQTFHEFAAFSVRQSVWAGAFYEQKRAQGKDHHAAVRALAFKWIRILYRCWRDSKPYQESRYLEALERRGSALVRELPVSVESPHSEWFSHEPIPVLPAKTSYDAELLDIETSGEDKIRVLGPDGQ